MTSLHPLANSVGHPSPKRHDVSPTLIIAGLFAAPASWSVQLLASYILNGDRCHDVGAQGSAAFEATSVWVATLGVLAVAGGAIGFWAAYRTWRQTRDEARGDHHVALTSGHGRTRFLGLSGMVASFFFLVGSLLGLLVPLLESSCGRLLP